MKKNNLAVLLVGGGGREHALTWKILQSPMLGKLYVAPGNAGTSKIAENVPIKATDIEGLLNFALEKNIDITIVGQDDPLAMGIVDLFMEKGLMIFGPTKAAAMIEASKDFSKGIMQRAKVPTASFSVFSDYTQASEMVSKHFANSEVKPIVIKASGLALGKGVYVCQNLQEAENALDEIMLKQLHGSAGDTVVIEDFIDGPEVSTHAFCDGTSFKMFPSSQDHKTIFDGDQGPNTGGMGTIAPLPWFNQMDYVGDKVVQPILAKMKEEGYSFVGLLYPGLKIPNDNNPMVLEFNSRFGDPETQVYMRLLKTDILEIFIACVEGRLHEIDIEWNSGFAACVAMASFGYPSTNYRKGDSITGIEDAEKIPDVLVFHAGTKYDENGQLVTSGGRVLYASAIGATLEEALNTAYQGIKCIHFEGAQYRTDIGAKSLR